MEHVAIDLGGRESQICVRDEKGNLVEELRFPTRKLGAYLARRPPSRVILETCAEGFAVADAAKAAGHEVRVVPATLVKALGVGERGVKTDQRDARKLSEVSARVDLPSVHVPSEQSRLRKTLSGMREALVGARTQLVNTVRGWLRTKNRGGLKSGGVETFPSRVRKRIEAMPPSAERRCVERQLETIEMLSRQIADADKELEANAKGDPVCERLMTVPGVGPVTAVRFVAAIDDVGRFATGHAVASYIGLTPGESSSSDHKRVTRITKAGPTRLRWALVQAAWCARRTAKSHPMVQWSDEVERRRGKRIATVALARKLAGVLYAIWRDGTTYDAALGASPAVSAHEDERKLEAALQLLSKGKGKRQRK